MSDHYQLTADDVSAMRKVGSYFGTCFHTYAGGHSMITLTIGEHDSDRIYTVPEQRLFNKVDKMFPRGRSREITCSARLQDYGSGSGPYMAFHSWMEGLNWRTLAQSARPGDVITLYWERDCNSGRDNTLFEAGFRTDRLTVELGDPDRKRATRSFLIAEQTGLDNTARMVQREAAYNVHAFRDSLNVRA